MIYRIRIKQPNGHIAVVDKTHSQMSAYLGDIGSKIFKRFLGKNEITAANGDAVLFVGYA